MKEKAYYISEFTDSTQTAIEGIKQVDDFEGNPSYQNSLETVRAQFETMAPPYAHKEVLIINSSITICDPDDINETIDSLKLDNIVCSVISLSAHIYVLGQFAKVTGGQFYLARNRDHFEEILQKYLVPQFTAKEI